MSALERSMDGRRMKCSACHSLTKVLPRFVRAIPADRHKHEMPPKQLYKHYCQGGKVWSR